MLRGRVVDIRAGEGHDLTVAFLTLFSFMTGHGVLETARDALFLSRLPAARLPWVYLAMAVAGLGAVWLVRRSSRPASRQLVTALGGAAAGTALLALGARSDAALVPYVVYVWVGLVATVVSVLFWQWLGDRFTVEQAKRLFALIGAGGLLGVALGSALAAWLATKLSWPGLIGVGAASVMVAALPSLMLGKDDEGSDRRQVALAPPYRIMFDEAHARRLLYLALTASVTLTLADYLFKSTVASAVERSQLATFFGGFYGAVNFVGLLLQIGATSWFLRRVGPVRGLAVLPTIVAALAAVFVALPALTVILAIKAADEALRHSVQRSAFEVLFLPLPGGARRSIKGVVEVVGQRGGQALASGAILVVVAAGVSPRWLAIGIVLLACLWLAGLVGATAIYLDLFRRRLGEGTRELATALPELNLAALEVLLTALSSVDETEVLAALGVLEQQGRGDLTPPLLMQHPSRAVALRALDLLVRSERSDLEPWVERLLESGDAARRVAALLALRVLAPHRRVLEAHLEDQDPRVRAAALVALAREPEHEAESVRRAAAIAAGSDPEMRLALAHAVAHAPDARWIPVLVALSKSADDGVLAEVARAARFLPNKALLPPLIEMLSKRELRDLARDALETNAEAAVEALGQALSDPRVALAARRHIPHTLARFDSKEAVRILFESLSAEQDGMVRYKILRALASMRVEDSSLRFDGERLETLTRATLARVVELMRLRVALQRHDSAASPTANGLVALLREKQQHATERLFRLLSLRESSRDLYPLYEGLQRADPRSRDASRQILAHTLDHELRETLLVLVDELEEMDKLSRLGASASIPSLREALEELRADRSEAVRLIAGHRHRELFDAGEETPGVLA